MQPELETNNAGTDSGLAKTGFWREEQRESAKKGDIWFSKSSFNSEGYDYRLPLRVPLLVIAEPHDAGRHTWLYVVPILLDTENATTSDLLLGANDTSLARELRVPLRGQARIATSQLDSYLGGLSDEGLSLLETCLAESIPAERSGSISDQDIADDGYTEAVSDAFKHLAGFHWHLREAGPEAVTSNPAVEHRVKGKSFVLLGSFQRLLGEPSHEWESRIAAKTSMARGSTWLRWETGPRLLEVRVDVDLWGGNVLRLAVMNARGIKHTVMIVVEAEGQGQIESAPFEPKPGASIDLAQTMALEFKDADHWELWESR
jgi:hypothetical protein